MGISPEFAALQNSASVASPLSRVLADNPLVLGQSLQVKVIHDHLEAPGHSDPNLLRVEMCDFYVARSISADGRRDGVEFVSASVIHSRSPLDGSDKFEVNRTLEQRTFGNFADVVEYLVHGDSFEAASLPSAHR